MRQGYDKQEMMKSERNQNKLRILEEQRASYEYIMPYVAKAFGENSDNYHGCMRQLVEIRQDISKLKERMMNGKNKKK